MHPLTIHSYWIGKTPNGSDTGSYFRLLPHFFKLVGSDTLEECVMGNTGVGQWLDSMRYGSVDILSQKVRVILCA